jgi:hypothetical protein
MNNWWKKPAEVYGLSFVLANLFLIISTVLFLVYLIAPLLGGRTVCQFLDTLWQLDWFGACNKNCFSMRSERT